MGMDEKLRKFLAEEELDIPARRGRVECGEFSDLFRKRNFESQYGASNLGQVFIDHGPTLNEFARDLLAADFGYVRDERVEIIYGSLHKLARTLGTTLFRLLTGATPEQEASFRFHDQYEMGLTFADYAWAVRYNVSPEEMYEAARAPGKAHGLLRASQGRVNDEVRIKHVQHVLYFGSGPRMKNLSEGYSSSIKELSAAYQEGYLPDAVFRALLSTPLDRDQFAAAVAALREGVNIEYAIAVA